jgi:replicative DNA helicase
VRRHRQIFVKTLRRAILKSRRPATEIAARAMVSPASLTNWSQGKTVPGVATPLRLREALSDSVELDVTDLARARKNAPNGLRLWLEDLGLWGNSAKDKFVPAVVFRAPREEVAPFLNRLFATDGWATVLASGQAQLEYCTVSEKLAKQIQHLLLRFGVVASLCERSVKHGESRRRAFQLNITDPRSMRTFVEEIGIFGKEAIIGRVRHALGDRRLRELAESDVYWDEIVSIEPLGMEQVYDLTIPVTHNFVANDICVHNTAMALNAIWHASGEKKLPVAIFSLEMSKEQLVQRLISQTTRIPAQALRSGNVKAEDWPKLVRGVAEVSRAPIWIDDTAGVTLMEIRAKVRRLASQLNVSGEMPLALVVVDYLQLMIGQGNRQENRQQEIAEISRGLKVLARDLDVPVLAIAQLSRAVETRHDKRPLLSDLRDSGAIEQDADVVMFLYRDEYYNPESDDKGIAEVIVGKHRNGPTGKVQLAWLEQYTKFASLARRS